MNNLPKVVTRKREAGNRTHDLRSRKSNALTTTPPGHTNDLIGCSETRKLERLVLSRFVPRVNSPIGINVFRTGVQFHLVHVFCEQTFRQQNKQTPPPGQCRTLQVTNQSQLCSCCSIPNRKMHSFKLIITVI